MTNTAEPAAVPVDDFTPSTELPDLTNTEAWDDATLDRLRVLTLTEQERRARLAQMPAQVAAMAVAYVQAGGTRSAIDDAINDATT